ncbi:MAG: glycosyltransferase family 2 protein [Acidimicrobiales bacterium]|nr:glycosyltransferase family 2 protein [Acidimicrobiales bacterium]
MQKTTSRLDPSHSCLSVVIPVFNEGKLISRCVERVLGESLVHDIVIVDDGSNDDTANQVAFYKEHPKVKISTHSINKGKGAALRTGFELAESAFVITQDADLEQDPSDYKSIIEPLFRDEADVVYGTRFSNLKRYRDQRFVHYFANRLLTSISNLKTGLNLTDMETGYKAFRHEVLESFVIEEDRFGVEPELTAKIANAGWRIVEVPISYVPRNVLDGKKIGWKDGLRTLYCVFKYS